MKWVFLIAAPDQLTAELWCDLLRREGIPAMIKPGDAVTFLGLSALPCRLMVPEGMIKEAEAVLADYLGL